MRNHVHSMNEHLCSCRPLCAFRYGLDKISVIQILDFENVGYFAGWVFLVNTTPYFYSVAGGSERLPNNLADVYACYLAEVSGEKHLVEQEEDGDWKLIDDLFLDFHAAFEAAMQEAGYVMDDGGKYVPAEELLPPEAGGPLTVPDECGAGEYHVE